MIVNNAKGLFLRGDINILQDNIKVMLLTDQYIPDAVNHEMIDDVSADEISATGYTAGGKSLSGRHISEDGANLRAEFQANPTVWSITGTATARYAAVYKDNGTPGSSPLIAIIDFGSNKTANNSDFNINWDSDGILQLS